MRLVPEAVGMAALIIIASHGAAQQGPRAAILPASQQIALAVLAAPKAMRDAATVLGYNAEGKLVTLRQGSGSLVCLSASPVEKLFHVSCYHKSLEPFMARGRAVRATLGEKRGVVDSVRGAEIKAGKLKMPQHAILYQLFAARDSVDAAGARLKGPSSLTVVYMPYATPETTGISTTPSPGTPWLMFPGQPWAHIMISQ